MITILDDKPITYSDTTIFEVQIGRFKSAYKTRYSFTGNLAQAVFYYRAINIGNGYKKRLCASKLTLARAFS